MLHMEMAAVSIFLNHADIDLTLNAFPRIVTSLSSTLLRSV